MLMYPPGSLSIECGICGAVCQFGTHAAEAARSSDAGYMAYLSCGGCNIQLMYSPPTWPLLRPVVPAARLSYTSPLHALDMRRYRCGCEIEWRRHGELRWTDARAFTRVALLSYPRTADKVKCSVCNYISPTAVPLGASKRDCLSMQSHRRHVRSESAEGRGQMRAAT